MRGLLLIALSVLLAVWFGYVERAHATAPGRNGRIVFRRFLDVEKTRAAIFTVNPSGTVVKRVTRPAARVIDTEPDWSPGGSRIAFERQLPCPAGGSKDGLNNTCDLVYTVNPSGRGLKRLVSCGFASEAPFPANCVGADQPAWSPDGTRLAFIYNLADSTYVSSLKLDAGIWIVNADGTGLHQVTQRTPGFGPEGAPDVFVMKADGSKIRAVTRTRLSDSGTDWGPLFPR
jgi:Tol biopolymer transport system component